MTSPTQLKKGLQKAIVQLIERDKQIEAQQTIAQLSLETGFTYKTIKNMIELMIMAKQITMKGNTITKYETKEKKQ